ncbi:Cytochrome P450 monooxygenase bsc2 [Exserohilum turcicum]
MDTSETPYIRDSLLNVWLTTLLVSILATAAYVKFQSTPRPYSSFPVVTLDGPSEINATHAANWFRRGRALVNKGLKEVSGAFQISNGRGSWIILPSKYMDELRNHPDMSLRDALREENFPDYRGFDGFRQAFKDSTFTQEVIRVKVTQSLGLITANLASECQHALHESLGESREWQQRFIIEDILNIVAQLTSRVFLGERLCRDKEWLQITKEYARNSFMGSEQLRQCLPLTCPLMQFFMPACTQLRKFSAAARRLIDPEVKARKRRAEEVIKLGKKPLKVEDTIGWMVEVARGRQVDYVGGQLALSLAAIHSSTDNLSKAVVKLCEMPEIVAPLRDEITTVLESTGGWSKLALHRMRLLDSFLKEVQRLAPFTIGMHRRVMKGHVLSDGTQLPKNSRIMVMNDKLRDSSVYEDPDTFKYDRFARLREQPGQEDQHQLASTSSDFATFGHGEHACPGRFFAANQLKITTACLLLKYDFRFQPGQAERAHVVPFEMVETIDPTLKVEVRRRSEELDVTKVAKETG